MSCVESVREVVSVFLKLSFVFDDPQLLLIRPRATILAAVRSILSMRWQTLNDTFCGSQRSGMHRGTAPDLLRRAVDTSSTTSHPNSRGYQVQDGCTLGKTTLTCGLDLSDSVSTLSPNHKVCLQTRAALASSRHVYFATTSLGRTGYTIPSCMSCFRDT